MDNNTERINGVGFNMDWARTVTLKEFIDRHKHLWPNKKPAAVETDLRRIYYLANPNGKRDELAIGNGD